MRPVAQLDRAFASEAKGREFESRRAHHFPVSTNHRNDAKATIQIMLIRDRLAAGKTSISFEFFPPKSDEASAQLERTIAELRELDPAFVSVTYDAGGSTREKVPSRSSPVSANTPASKRWPISPASVPLGKRSAQLSPAWRQPASPISSRCGAIRLKVRPALPQWKVDSLMPTSSWHSSGNSMACPFHWVALPIPEKHVECANPAVDLEELQTQKWMPASTFLITQLFFDNRRYYGEFCEQARVAGISVPIIPGIMPITSAAQVERFTIAYGTTLPYRLAEELDNRRADPQAVMQNSALPTLRPSV